MLSLSIMYRNYMCLGDSHLRETPNYKMEQKKLYLVTVNQNPNNKDSEHSKGNV